MRIDMHTHIMPPTLPRWADEFGYEGFIHIEHHRSGYARMMMGDRFFREVEANCWDPERRLQEMARHHIDVQVIYTIPVLFNYFAQPEHALQTARYLNDHIAEVCRAYPRRFVGLATLPLQDPQLAIQELERCMAIGLSGIQIGSHINQWNLHEPVFYPLWQACEQLGACVFVHPWEMMGERDMPRYWLPWLVGMPAETSRAICSMIFGGIFERYPAMRVAFSHGGGSFGATIGRIEKGFQARPDLVAIDNPHSPLRYLGHFWVDSVVFDPTMLQYNINLYGANRVMLGSDYPFPLGELQTGQVIEQLQPDTELAQLLYADNALAWLGKQRSDFQPHET